MDHPNAPTPSWIASVPPLEDLGETAVLALDVASAVPGARMAALLLGRGHEGPEGVFHLLPSDLPARYEAAGHHLTVALTAPRDLLAGLLAGHPDGLHDHLSGLPRDPADEDRVVLLRRALPPGFHPAERDGGRRPVLVLDHDAGPVALPDLLSLIERGEAGIAVVTAV
ncbi:hypothetical protein [Streptomyces sp. AD55]|uniref:hypothetical protein n=1 Tax=Streptomyces sp. AD55 TaxID=3242895 RepID=UPI0035294A52